MWHEIARVTQVAVDLLHEHAGWVAPAVLVLVFIKSLAFVSLVLPTSVTVVLLTSLIASGLPALPIWAAASLGAALGDWVSYLLGAHLQGRLHSFWPFAGHPERLARGEAFFRRWGVASVVLCRFFSPLRATVPLLCGAFAMPQWQFQLANWASAPVWSALILLPGGVLSAWLR